MYFWRNSLDQTAGCVSTSLIQKGIIREFARPRRQRHGIEGETTVMLLQERRQVATSATKPGSRYYLFCGDSGASVIGCGVLKALAERDFGKRRLMP